jgi:hypothetical protein
MPLGLALRTVVRLAFLSLQWALRDLTSRYDQEKIYQEIWTEPIQQVAKDTTYSVFDLVPAC